VCLFPLPPIAYLTESKKNSMRINKSFNHPNYQRHDSPIVVSRYEEHLITAYHNSNNKTKASYLPNRPREHIAGNEMHTHTSNPLPYKIKTTLC